MPPKLRGGSRRGNQPFDVARDAFVDREHRRLVADGAQAREIGLGEVLVLAGKRRRERDVRDHARPHEIRHRLSRLAGGGAARIDRRRRDGIERRGLSAAEVEDPVALRVVEKIEIDLDDVLDRDEVAALLACRVAARALEQPDPAFAQVLAAEMPGDRGHPLLVLLARTVDVEVAEADDLRGALGKQPAHVLVEQELRIAVDVERRLERALLAKHAAPAVDRGARRIQERHVVVLAPFQQRHRIAVVVAHHVPAVGLHRVGARALVQHRRDVVVEVAFGETRQELVLVQVVGDLAIDEIGELVGARQVVDGDDGGFAALVQRANQVRADEAGRAGDDDVHGNLLEFDVQAGRRW